MDLVREVGRILATVILTCAFGEDVGDHEVDYYVDGILTKSPASRVLRDTF
jgi:hypothetical protein